MDDMSQYMGPMYWDMSMYCDMSSRVYPMYDDMSQYMALCHSTWDPVYDDMS